MPAAKTGRRRRGTPARSLFSVTAHLHAVLDEARGTRRVWTIRGDEPCGGLRTRHVIHRMPKVGIDESHGHIGYTKG
jgi:hypothetical protein